MSVLEDLASEGFRCTNETIEILTEQYLSENNAEDASKPLTTQEITKVILNANFTELKMQRIIPFDLKKSTKLTGKYVLQLVSIVNACCPQNASLNVASQKTKHNRLLRVTFTDGYEKINAIETIPCTELNLNIPPGTKFVFVDPSFSRGFLSLDPKKFRILGGAVKNLVEEWEVSRKASIFVLKGAEIASNGAPRFVEFSEESASPVFVPRAPKEKKRTEIEKSNEAQEHQSKTIVHKESSSQRTEPAKESVVIQKPQHEKTISRSSKVSKKAENKVQEGRESDESHRVVIIRRARKPENSEEGTSVKIKKPAKATTEDQSPTQHSQKTSSETNRIRIVRKQKLLTEEQQK